MIKNKFTYLNANLIFVCSLREESLELILLDSSQITRQADEQNSKYYYKKIYTNQNCPKGQFSMFDTIDKLYKVFQILKDQQNLLLLKHGIISMSIQILFQNVSKEFQLQKTEFTQIENYIMQSSQNIVQSIKEQLRKQKEKYQKLIKKQKQLYKDLQTQNKNKICKLFNEKQQLINDLDQSLKIIQQLKRYYEYKIAHLQKKFEDQQANNQTPKDKMSLQIENSIDIQRIMEIKSKQSIKIQKIRQKLGSIKYLKQKQFDQQEQYVKLQKIQQKLKEFNIKINQQSRRKYLFDVENQIDNDLNSGISACLSCNNKKINSLVYFERTQKLWKSQIIIHKFFKMMKSQNLNAITILNLDKSNIQDKGWQMLLNLSFPSLIKLSAANNNLVNIKFNDNIINLGVLCLADNRKLGEYPNRLSNKTIQQMLSCKWLNLNILSIDFKEYCYYHGKMKCNQNQARSFAYNGFSSFPKLQNLYCGNYCQNQLIKCLEQIRYDLIQRKVNIIQDYYTV